MENAPEQKIAPIEVENEFDLKMFFLVLSKRFWILVVATLVVMTADFFYTKNQPILYDATTSVMIEIPSSSAYTSKEAQAPSIGQTDYFTSQYEVIKSQSVAHRVIVDLNLKSLPEFKDDIPEAVFQGMVTVRPIRNSRLVNITVEYKDPALAAQMANGLADAFIKQNAENMQFMSQEILKALPDDLQKTEKTTAQGAVTEEKQEKKTDALLLPSIVNNTMLQGLKMEKAKINSEIAELSKRYKHKHPKMIAANTKLKVINDQIVEQTKNILLSVKADLGGSLRANNIRVVDTAQAPRLPSKPNKLKNAVLGLMLSLLLGGGIIYILEKLDDTVKTQEDIQRRLRLPFFGDFPFLKEMSNLPDTFEKFNILEKNLNASTSIREIRTGLTFAIQKKTAQIVTITSSVPKEGKSFLATYLAYSFAKNGMKTLLIDGDLRVPVIHRSFNIPSSPGLANLLTEAIPLDTAIAITPLPTLFVLPAGKSQFNPTELFSLPKMRTIIETFSEVFDKIIIDAPPSLLIPDALVLSKVSDGTILVARSGLLHIRTLLNVKEKFEIIGSSMMGFILNGSHFGKHKYYGSHYKRYYHDAATSQTAKNKAAEVKISLKAPPPQPKR